MIFKAVKTIGEFEIDTLRGDRVKYTISPFDIEKMNKVQELSEDDSLKNDERILGQIRLFCDEFNRDDFAGIPIEDLQRMLEYIIETSQGKKRTETEKKTAQKEHLKS